MTSSAFDDLKAYVAGLCSQTEARGRAVDIHRMPLHHYRQGALVFPLGFESDECQWFVEFAISVRERVAFYRLDLGQARFRFSGVDDVAYPGAIRKNQAEVKRDELIEALDARFGPNDVNAACQTAEDAMQVCNRIWPHVRE